MQAAKSSLVIYLFSSWFPCFKLALLFICSKISNNVSFYPLFRNICNSIFNPRILDSEILIHRKCVRYVYKVIRAQHMNVLWELLYGLWLWNFPFSYTRCKISFFLFHSSFSLLLVFFFWLPSPNLSETLSQAKYHHLENCRNYNLSQQSKAPFP